MIFISERRVEAQVSKFQSFNVTGKSYREEQVSRLPEVSGVALKSSKEQKRNRPPKRAIVTLKP
jgi:hypothetical protein